MLFPIPGSPPKSTAEPRINHRPAHDPVPKFQRTPARRAGSTDSSGTGNAVLSFRSALWFWLRPLCSIVRTRGSVQAILVLRGHRPNSDIWSKAFSYWFYRILGARRFNRRAHRLAQLHAHRLVKWLALSAFVSSRQSLVRASTRASTSYNAFAFEIVSR